MSIQHIAGSSNPVTTGIARKDDGNKSSCVVTLEAPISTLETALASIEDYVPAGMVAENSSLDPTGEGCGRLTINCISYGSGDVSTTPTRITWRIAMIEVQKDLKFHPHFDDGTGEAVMQIEKWLATDPEKRYDGNGNPQYIDENGNPCQLGNLAEDYVDAYQKGIETYVAHYPVVEKISYYKTLPGCSMSVNSTTSGTVNQFSSNIDKWDIPAVKLAGYSNTGWFKSGDNYEQGGDLVWTRTEQWTWTPEGSTSSTGWIYQSADD